jgi:hypothetical protein
MTRAGRKQYAKQVMLLINGKNRDSEILILKLLRLEASKASYRNLSITARSSTTETIKKSSVRASIRLATHPLRLLEIGLPLHPFRGIDRMDSVLHAAPKQREEILVVVIRL